LRHQSQASNHATLEAGGGSDARIVLVEMTPRVLGTFASERLGILYILSALLFLSVGGVEALIIRIQLIHAHNNFVSPQVFNRMFTMHGTTMIFFVVMPVLFGFANYLVPLMIGARDMAFPRLNAFSFWLSFLGGLLLYFSFLGGSGLYGAGNAPDVGWWAYAPLSARVFSPGHRRKGLASGYLVVTTRVTPCPL
jgi:cytochrome c oxidase subunit I